MGSDKAASISNGDISKKASNYEEIFMQQSLKFAESLKGLKSLKEQLYSAAEYFETSYAKESDHKQFVVDSSKDYVAKALVSTVDHLGSVADKLNKFLDQKATDFSATKVRFSCTEQRLNMFQGLIDSRGIMQNSLMIQASKYHKRYIVPGVEAYHDNKSRLVYKNCISCPEYDDMYLDKQDDSIVKVLQGTVKKRQPPFSRKGHFRTGSNESPPSPPNFSFTRVITNKDIVPVKRSISPLRFVLKRSGSVSNRSSSPNILDNNKQLFQSEPRRAISVSRRPEIPNKEREIELYTKRSKHLFRALLNVRSSRK